MTETQINNKEVFKYINLTPFSKLTPFSYATFYRIAKNERDVDDKEMQSIRTALQHVEDCLAGAIPAKSVNIEREVDALVSDFLRSDTHVSSRNIYADCNLSVSLYSKFQSSKEGIILEVEATKEQDSCNLSLYVDAIDKAKIVNAIKRLMRVFAY